jgi:hypothetical protein
VWGTDGARNAVVSIPIGTPNSGDPEMVGALLVGRAARRTIAGEVLREAP